MTRRKSYTFDSEKIGRYSTIHVPYSQMADVWEKTGTRHQNRHFRIKQFSCERKLTESLAYSVDKLCSSKFSRSLVLFQRSKL